MAVKSILYLTLFVLVLGTLAAGDSIAADGDVVVLHDGGDLSQWKGRDDLWSVQDGAIVGRTTAENPLKHNTFLVWQGGQPDDFELTLEFKIDAGNSGIQYRSNVVDAEQWIVGGYQADVDFSNAYAGILYEEKGRGILATRGQRVVIGDDGKKTVESFATAEELAEHIKPGQWNTFRIVADGNHVQHFINDAKMVDVTDHQSDEAPTRGVIALQLHVGQPMTVHYKNIKLRKL